MWTTADGVGHQSDAHNRILFWVSESYPPAPFTGVPIAIYFGFRAFYTRYDLDVRGQRGRVSSKWTMLYGVGGGGPQKQFLLGRL